MDYSGRKNLQHPPWSYPCLLSLLSSPHACSTASKLEANIKELRWIIESNKVSCKINSVLSNIQLWLWIWQAGLLSALGSLGLMIWLMTTPHSHETEQKRLGLLAGFAFLTGMYVTDSSNFGVWGVETVYFSTSLDQGQRFVFILIHCNWYTYCSTLYLNVFCFVLLSYFM